MKKLLILLFSAGLLTACGDGDVYTLYRNSMVIGVVTEEFMLQPLILLVVKPITMETVKLLKNYFKHNRESKQSFGAKKAEVLKLL